MSRKSSATLCIHKWNSSVRLEIFGYNNVAVEWAENLNSRDVWLVFKNPVA